MPPPVGEAARLDKALQEEMPRAVRLRDVEEGLQSKYQELYRRFPDEIGQIPYFYVYPLLKNAVINQKPAK